MKKWRRTLQCASWVSPALLSAAAREAPCQPVGNPGSMQLLWPALCSSSYAAQAWIAALAKAICSCACELPPWIVLRVVIVPCIHTLRPRECCCVPSCHSSTRNCKLCLTVGFLTAPCCQIVPCKEAVRGLPRLRPCTGWTSAQRQKKQGLCPSSPYPPSAPHCPTWHSKLIRAKHDTRLLQARTLVTMEAPTRSHTTCTRSMERCGCWTRPSVVSWMRSVVGHVPI